MKRAVDSITSHEPGDVVLVGHGTAWTLLIADLLDELPNLKGLPRMSMPDLLTVDLSQRTERESVGWLAPQVDTQRTTSGRDGQAVAALRHGWLAPAYGGSVSVTVPHPARVPSSPVVSGVRLGGGRGWSKPRHEVREPRATGARDAPAPATRVARPGSPGSAAAGPRRSRTGLSVGGRGPSAVTGSQDAGSAPRPATS